MSFTFADFMEEFYERQASLREKEARRKKSSSGSCTCKSCVCETKRKEDAAQEYSESFADSI